MTRWWWPRSVRVRLTLWYAGALTVVLLLYAGGVFIFLRHSLAAELDRRLHEDFEVAEQMLERTADGGIRWRADDHHHDEDASDEGWLDVWSPEGKLLYRSASFASGGGGAPSFGLPTPRQRYESVTLPGEVHIRTLSSSYLIDSLPVVIRVARSAERLRRELDDLLLVLLLGLPVAVGITGVGGYALARRALAPVNRMADRARIITADRLGERLPVVTPDDELGHLATVFNDTFARLERSFEQLRRFTSDASHELRTPLTAIRSVGEVGLREHRDENAYREIIGSMLEEADRLGRLVDSLLTLSRAEAGQMKLTLDRVDLGELVREVANHLGVLAEEKRQSLSVEATAPVYATVDRLVFRQAVINLVDNAVKYSSEGGHVRIVVQDQPQGPALQVIDTGPGIGVEDQKRIFDRFYRVDKARSRELGGTGLGLAIARWAVEAHGGRIELESEEGKGSTFRITLSSTQA
ncbi:MAG: heavy metal sensor histidine kinase [Deltaproteobacteria bacterium]|nr:heavy metal sensor histidine kinase [Deltaproteobacteria bacterium]